MSGLVAKHRLELDHFLVAVVAFGLGAAMAVMQALSRAGFALPGRSEAMYYLSVTAHGVLMSLVFTTFFIMGLGYVFVRRCLGEIALPGLARASWWVALFGTVMTTLAILSGSSTVLYTFYPPLQAHWSFYVGATLLIVGSWGWCAVMLISLRRWRKAHPDQAVPLAVHGMVTTVLVWLLATAGLAVEDLGQLLPWVFGLVDGIDPLIARTWFWWFGHPLTYFWLLPAYVIWYSVLPAAAGGRLFSDYLGRVVFVMFILFSTPVGFHHQFVDPGIDSAWKLAHTASTYAILFPSLVTAFTIVASLEVAGRLRGGTGLFGWIKRLPWRDPFVVSVILAMLLFAVGGFGGAINAAFAMNAMVHNTAWIHGHFHLTVGSAVALSFLGVSYWLLPRLTGFELAFPKLAQWQPWLWFVGMVFFSFTTHAAGILGMPRRVFDGEYFGHPQAATWELLTLLSALGGVVLFVSSLFYLVVVIGTLARGRVLAEVPALELAKPLGWAPTHRTMWDRFGLWAGVAVILVLIAYAVPIAHLYSLERFPSGPFKPF